MESKTCTESNAEQTAFARLSAILDTLRKECPWDRAQTLKSLRYLTIEEVHELCEAIVNDNCEDLRKELGDIAMHVLFYSKIAEEQGLFSTADVYNTICEKLIDRHPFIYQKENYHGESWEQLKMREKDHRGVLDGVPTSLPSLVKAIRMQEKVAGRMSGSPRGDIGIATPDKLPLPTTEQELGDLLFSLIDWGRRHGINADDALCNANLRFRNQY